MTGLDTDIDFPMVESERPMTEAGWLLLKDSRTLLGFLREKGSSRKHRLFAVACCYRVRHLLTGDNSWPAVQVAEKQVEVGEQYEIEMWLDEELADAQNSLEIVPPVGIPYPNAPAYYATWQNAPDAAESTAIASLEAIQYVKGDIEAERASQVSTIRDIFGNPFRPITLNPSWLTSTVHALANGIYNEKAFDRMPILGDALQDAGCDNDDIPNYCREPKEHVRGCWLVDLLTDQK